MNEQELVFYPRQVPVLSFRAQRESSLGHRMRLVGKDGTAMLIDENGVICASANIPSPSAVKMKITYINGDIEYVVYEVIQESA